MPYALESVCNTLPRADERRAPAGGEFLALNSSHISSILTNSTPSLDNKYCITLHIKYQVLFEQDLHHLYHNIPLKHFQSMGMT